MRKGGGGGFLLAYDVADVHETGEGKEKRRGTGMEPE